jgi:hypothetical protein
MRHQRTCQSEGLVSLPLIFSNIEGNRLALFGYNIGAQARGISQVLQLNHDGLFKVQHLVLDGCGLKDEGFALILKGMMKQEWVDSISYSNDELGPKSLEHLKEMHTREAAGRTGKPLSKLCLYSLKLSDSVKIGMIEALRGFSALKKVKISSINLSDNRVFALVFQFFQDVQFQGHAQELDFSNCQLKSKQLVQISETLAENKSLCDLNLSQNKLGGRGSS